MLSRVSHRLSNDHVTSRRQPGDWDAVRACLDEYSMVGANAYSVRVRDRGSATRGEDLA